MAIKATARRAQTQAPASVSEDSWIEIDGLDKEYRPRKSTPTQALSDINLTVRRGEFISVVGPSGCGKTTLLKILAGLSPKTGGAVRIAGRDVTKPFPRSGWCSRHRRCCRGAPSSTT